VVDETINPAGETAYRQAKMKMPGNAYGHLLAYRVWRFRFMVREDKDDEFHLLSLTNAHEWKPGEPSAARIEPDRAWSISRPTIGQIIGMYAYKSLQNKSPFNDIFCKGPVVSWPNNWMPAPDFLSIIVGTIFGGVYLWGDIIEHEEGYRAQFAYPASFLDIKPRGPIYPGSRRCSENIDYSLQEFYVRALRVGAALFGIPINRPGDHSE